MPASSQVREVVPRGFIGKKLPALWRSFGLSRALKEHGIELYHGLSHEIPVGIQKTGIRSIVTVHDLIFERYPHQYGAYEVRMHRKKIQFACRYANAVIAASEQTRNDLIEFYKVRVEKIVIGYQSCHAAFGRKASEAVKTQLRQQYGLPEQFFLYVGSVIERKNLLRICQAMQAAGVALQLPLVVVGNGGAYKETVTAFLNAHGLLSRVLFLSDVKPEPATLNLNLPENLSALYQMATALIYPSIFEGFGIPVLEAMSAGVPVITSNISSMPEIGADAVCYVDPFNVNSIQEALVQVQDDTALRNHFREKGLQRAQQFSLQACTDVVMQVYQKVTAHGGL